MALKKQITIESNGGEKTLEALGLSGAMLYIRNMAPCEFAVRHEGRAFDAAPLFEDGAAIKVRLGRSVAATPSGGAPFSGGVIIFQGTCVSAPAMAEGNYEGYDYIFQNGWLDLEDITFGQKWRTWSKPLVGPPSSAYIETSEVNLPTSVNSATNAVTRISNGEQVSKVIEWAIAHGANLQAGVISPALYIPVDQKRDLKCAEVIRMMLKLCPDAVCDIDDSTEPPTFHCIQRPQMAPITVKLSDEKVSRLKLVRRDDLVVPSVVIKYKRTDEVDGRPRVLAPFVDVAPEGATGFEPGALMQTIDLFGAKVQNIYGSIESEEIPPSENGPDGLPGGGGPEYVPDDQQWWIDHGVTWLKDVTNLKITPTLRTGDLLLASALLPDSAGIANWMRADNGTPAVSETETFEALVSYDAQGNKITNQRISVRLRTTNLATGTYSARKSSEAGEVAVAGLSAALLASLSVVHHDGQVSLTEEECGTDIGLRNTLNISGGTGRYAAMNACVQEVTYDLTNGTRTLTLGWPKHLGLDDIVEIMRFNRVRRVWNNPNLQGSGEFSDESDIEIPDGPAMEDAAAGEAKYRVFGADNGSAAPTTPGGPPAVPVQEANRVELSGPGGHLYIVSNGGSPGTHAGSVRVALQDCAGREVKLRVMSFCVKDSQSGQRSEKQAVVLMSDFF